MIHKKMKDEKANLILNLIDNLKIEYGCEGSFKMLQKQMLWNRFLVGIVNSEQETFFSICKQMGMPDKYFKYFQENISEANMILFGFEENEKGCIYKVYLEFWDKLKHEISRKVNKTDPFLLYLGFKWNPLDSNAGSIARYTCYPLISVKTILKKISCIYDNYQDKVSFEIAKEIINISADKITNDSFVYLEVSEDNNSRFSFDINLYKAQLHLKDISRFLFQMCQYYSIDQETFNFLYKQVYTKKLGHLSGGINREGNDFLTTYYEI